MRLKKHLPNFINDILEYEEMDKTHTVELDLLDADIKELQDNQFVYTANEKGLSRFETMFKIEPHTDIDVRRFNILSLYNSASPFTDRWLRNTLNTLVGEGMYILNIDYDKYTVNLSVVDDKLNIFPSLLQYLRRRIPANMAINLGTLDTIEADIYTAVVIQTGDKQII